MDEVSDALSKRLGLVGAGRWLCRKRETFSSVGGWVECVGSGGIYGRD